MSKTGKVNKLNQHISESYLEINPADAAKRKIKDNDIVEIFNGRGNVRVKAKFSTDIKPGVVSCPCTGVKILNSDLNSGNI
jgi:ferredoxin-nitrate reductase